MPEQCALIQIYSRFRIAFRISEKEKEIPENYKKPARNAMCMHYNEIIPVDLLSVSRRNDA